jgi:uncharacterized protein
MIFRIFFLVLMGTAVLAADLVKYPVPNGFVNDYAQILSVDEACQLESISTNLKEHNGAELGIAIVKTVAPLDSKSYAIGLFNNWQLGQKGKDNGVLILLARQERRIEIEVGYGLEGILNDAKCGEIIDKFALPSFKHGKMGEGLIATAQKIATDISGPETNRPAATTESESFDFLIVLIILLIIIFLTIVTRGRFLGVLISFMLSYSPRGGGRGFGGFGGGRSGGGGAGRSW